MVEQVHLRNIGAALAVAAAAALPVAARAPATPDGARARTAPTEPCPERARPRPARARRLWNLLAGTRRGPELLAAGPPVRICFAATDEPAVVHGGLVVLDDRVDDRESAARLGHLLLHARAGMPLPEQLDPSTSCERGVARAVRAEAAAHALELELRRELGVRFPRRAFAFEQRFWQSAPADRIDWLRRYFIEHPDGAPGVPGFVRAYRQQCEAQRRAGAPGPAGSARAAP